jgi:ribonucleoside-diphosphate reductase alpha chain
MEQLPSEYQSFIHLSRYARWQDDKGRREVWPETVGRSRDYWTNKFPKYKKEIKEVFGQVEDLETMPSMRAMMTAGEALDRDNVAGFNCSYLAINRVRAFDELMYVLMCGTGVGFSVERQFISQLPEIAEEFYDTETSIVVADSKIGWATAYKELLASLYAGAIPKWDTSKVRPKGSRLKTFGGRASGPEPLEDLFRFTVEVMTNAAGRKLNSVECHDLVCKIADIVVVGGVRRSALISLSNLTDERMRVAKSGQWWEDNGQRALANNSVAYTEKPDMSIFLKEWGALYESKSGERGIFNREAAKKLCPERRDTSYDFGTNPCSEIILRDRQFCNLSEVVVRHTDTVDDLTRKVRTATILGTLQSTLTDFRYLSKAWKKNTDEEALLGVSLTGIMDHPVLNNMDDAALLEDLLQELKEVAIETNKEWAKKLGINPSASITCVKPSGTVSQLVDSASGIHPRYSEYYIRTVRADAKDPLARFMTDEGFPVEPDVMKPTSGQVFSFPTKAPAGSVFRDDRTAVEQLEMWKIYQLNWCEHKPSITVYVKDDEVMEVGAWVWKNFDICSGVSFLPHSNHSYQQAPYQEINEERYEELLAKMPKDVDWSKVGEYETEDNTSGTQTLACSSGSCEVVDLVDEVA